MLKKLLAAPLLAITIFSCTSGQFTEKAPAFIDVYLEQDGKIINFVDDTATVKPGQFRFVFNFSEPDSVFLNASFMPDSYNMAWSGYLIDEIPGFRNTGVTEEQLNAEYSISVSTDSPNYWYYTNDTDNRFDSVTKNDFGYSCRRTVSCIIDLDRNGQKTEVSKINGSILYLVIVKAEWNDNFTGRIEHARRSLKIIFSD